jgi:hypothetical protein
MKKRMQKDSNSVLLEGVDAKKLLLTKSLKQ